MAEQCGKYTVNEHLGTETCCMKGCRCSADWIVSAPPTPFYFEGEKLGEQTNSLLVCDEHIEFIKSKLREEV